MRALILSTTALLLLFSVQAGAEPKPDDKKAFIEANNKAIENGCKYLESVQEKDGSFPVAWATKEYEAAGQAFCLLALLHGGRDRDAEHMRRGLAMLDKMIARANLRESYSPGIVLMMYQKLYEPQQWKAELFTAKPGKEFEAARRKAWKSVNSKHKSNIEAMLEYLDGAAVDGDRCGWGYVQLTRKDAKYPTVHSDNSCSQFAMLGYKSASLLGAKVDEEVFLKEARRLIRQYRDEGFGTPTEYEFDPLGNIGVAPGATGDEHLFKGGIRAGGWTYHCNDTQCSLSMQLTAAGLGSLAICLDELKAREAITRDTELELAQQIGLCMRGASAYLAFKYYSEAQIADPDFNGTDIINTAGDGIGLYYNLYAIERGCVFADMQTIGKTIDWYAVGARGLVKSQGNDGSWPLRKGYMPFQEMAKTRVIDTSMAILFLRQASVPVVTEHVRRDKERAERLGETPPAEAEPASPVTPSGKK